jgi:hypothetical protein
MDLAKLRPIELVAQSISCDHTEEEAEFYRLARSATEIMIRRYRWTVSSDDWGETFVIGTSGGYELYHWSRQQKFTDPLTCWIGCEKWYKENVENTDHQNKECSSANGVQRTSETP